MMQFNYPKILPSFTLALTAKSDSPDLPDYYRTTREEVYGPSCRIPEQPVDLMKTIDHRFRDSSDYEYDFMPPDPFVNGDEDASSSTIFEEHAPQRHMSFSGAEKSKATRSKAAWRPLATFWHRIKSTAHRLHCAKSAGRNLNFD